MERQVVLITGAQRGIGKAIALKAAQNGFAVVLNHLEEELLALEVLEEIEAGGGQGMRCCCDVSDVPAVYEMVRQVESRWGRLDALVNNAGIFPRSTFLELGEDMWDRVLDVNLKSTCFVSQACAKLMIKGGSGGSIVNMASSAIQGVPFGTAYTASKGGIVALTRTMAVELGTYGIRVNAIAPGLTNTQQPRQGLSEEQIAARARAAPLGRMAEAIDIAELALFLMLPGSSMISGQTLHVNGGDYRP
jgi:3-oxoacyl-[acyl-carrier protein] reductase